jgi:hypothetical protein
MTIMREWCLVDPDKVTPIPPPDYTALWRPLYDW